MNVTVLGLWHLGCVTAACCAKHFNVTGLEFDAGNLARLRRGQALVREPGLEKLLQAALESGRLKLTDDVAQGCGGADILWVAYDTPVDDHDVADVDSVITAIRRCVPTLPQRALVLISSQLPIGTCRRLEQEFAGHGCRFAVSPENLRLGRAIEDFIHPERIVVGSRDPRTQLELAKLFSPFCGNLVWMSPESAEMTKHALNSFLAASVAFMNEIACLCDQTGADAREVERGLKSDARIGPQAYLSAGAAFAGGTLARDVVTLGTLAAQVHEPLELLPAIKRSNDWHREWPLRVIRRHFSGQRPSVVALLGLTYKPGTNTLRRSPALEMARALHRDGSEVRAFDPGNPPLPADCTFIQLNTDAAAAVCGADAVVLCTAWPEFRELKWSDLVDPDRILLIVDPARFLGECVSSVPSVRYVFVGKSK